MIREVKREDLSECAEVIRKSFRTVADRFGLTEENAPRFTAFSTTEERLLRHMDFERRLMFLEEEDGVIRGYYSLLLMDQGKCELSNLSVLPGYRHMGIGGGLLRHAADTARDHGCDVMEFGIVEENTTLRQWYERCGAVHTGAVKYDFFPFTCGYMHIRLSEKSCGAVIFCEKDGRVRYLLVRGHDGYWGFPKGHVMEGESEQDTALREIREETGLEVTLIDAFTTTDEHRLAREGFPNTLKRNVYFLGRYDHWEPAIQKNEIAEAALLEYEQAMDILAVDSFRRILTEADTFLKDMTGR